MHAVIDLDVKNHLEFSIQEGTTHGISFRALICILLTAKFFLAVQAKRKASEKVNY